MVNLLRVLTVAVALYGFLPAARPAEGQASKKDDVLYLKDGRVIRGTIVEQLPNSETLLMRLHDGSYARFAKADIERIAQEGAQRERRDRPDGGSILGFEGPRVKDPTLAWFLSFFLAGGGQFYNGDIEKGVGVFVISAVAVGLYFSADPDTCECEGNGSQRAIGLLMGLAVWIGSQIDAPLSAKAINRVRGVALDLRPAPHHLGFSLASLRF